MPTFIYRAKNDKGQIVSGTVEAKNEHQGSQVLWENKLKVISIEPKPLVPQFSIFNHISVAEKAIFARQISTMVSAGLQLTAALEVCRNQTTKQYFKDVLKLVIQDIEGGYSLSSAMSKHPDVFDRVFVSVVKAGETAGKLDQVLLSLADRIEKDASFRGKVRGALIYPAFVFCVLIVIGALMMVKVIPQIKDILTESGVQLPVATRMLIWISDFLVRWWWLCSIVVVGLVFAYRYYIKTEAGAKKWGAVSIKIPLLGNLNKQIIMTRFTQTFALLIKTGIPLLDALYSLAEVMDNEVYKRSLYHIASEVERGIPLSVPLSKDKNYPQIISQMVAVGEQSGSLDKIMERLGQFYENTVDEKSKTVGALVEPVVIVLLGVAVGVLVFAVLVPIYQMSSAIQ